MKDPGKAYLIDPSRYCFNRLVRGGNVEAQWLFGNQVKAVLLDPEHMALALRLVKGGRGAVSVTWRLMKAGREVGRIELGDDGKVRASWPEDMPQERRRFIEEGREAVWNLAYSDHPRPEKAAWPIYWHEILTILTSSGWWDQVETDYKPPDFPIYEQGNQIYY